MRSHTYLTFVEAEVAKEGAALPVEYGEEQDGEAARKVQAGAAECGCHGEEHADESAVLAVHLEVRVELNGGDLHHEAGQVDHAEGEEEAGGEDRRKEVEISHEYDKLCEKPR